MTVQFSDFAVFPPILRPWIDCLIACAVIEGTIHLSLFDAYGSPVRVILHHCLYVPDLMTKTNGDISR
jgi:hypothetical protein